MREFPCGVSVSQRLGGAALGYVAIGLAAFANLLTLPIVLGGLGQAQFGIYSLVLAATNFFSLLGAGFNAAYLRFFWHGVVSGDSEEKVNRVFLSILGGMGVFAALIGAVMAPFVPDLLADDLSAPERALTIDLWLLMVPTVALSLPLGLFDSYLLARERIVWNKGIALVRQVMNPILFALVVQSSGGAVGMAAATLALYAGTGLWVAILCVCRLGFSARAPFDRGLAGRVWSFSLFLLITTVVDQVNWMAGRIILGWTAGVSEVAIYSLSSQIQMYYVMIPASLLAVFAPVAHELVARRDEAALGVQAGNVVRLQTATLGGVLVAFIPWGGQLLTSWAGWEYRSSFTVAAVLMLGSFVALSQNIVIEVQKARNMHRFRAVALALGAVFNIVVSIQLSERWGAVGAATGTAIVMIVIDGLIVGIYSQKCARVDIIAAWRSALASLWAAVLCSISVAYIMKTFLSSTMFGALAGVLCTVGAYAAVYWLAGISRAERSTVKRAWRKRCLT